MVRMLVQKRRIVTHTPFSFRLPPQGPKVPSFPMLAYRPRLQGHRGVPGATSYPSLGKGRQWCVVLSPPILPTRSWCWPPLWCCEHPHCFNQLMADNTTRIKSLPHPNHWQASYYPCLTTDLQDLIWAFLPGYRVKPKDLLIKLVSRKASFGILFLKKFHSQGGPEGYQEGTGLWVWFRLGWSGLRSNPRGLCVPGKSMLLDGSCLSSRRHKALNNYHLGIERLWFFAVSTNQKSPVDVRIKTSIRPWPGALLLCWHSASECWAVLWFILLFLHRCKFASCYSGCLQEYKCTDFWE